MAAPMVCAESSAKLQWCYSPGRSQFPWPMQFHAKKTRRLSGARSASALLKPMRYKTRKIKHYHRLAHSRHFGPAAVILPTVCMRLLSGRIVNFHRHWRQIFPLAALLWSSGVQGLAIPVIFFFLIVSAYRHTFTLPNPPPFSHCSISCQPHILFCLKILCRTRQPSIKGVFILAVSCWAVSALFALCTLLRHLATETEEKKTNSSFRCCLANTPLLRNKCARIRPQGGHVIAHHPTYQSAFFTSLCFDCDWLCHVLLLRGIAMHRGGAYTQISLLAHEFTCSR